jgi:branched-chain amino acid transport system substrate-binding protein
MNRSKVPTFFFIALLFFLIGASAGYFVCNNKELFHISKDIIKLDEKTVRIGAILPLTGDLAKLGESGKNGLLMARDYINSKEGKKIEIVFEDGQGKPASSINALNKLLSINKSTTIFSIISSIDLSIIPIQQKENFLFFSHSTHPKLSNVNNLVFRHSPTVEQESSMIIEYLKNQTNVTTLYSNDDYGLAFNDKIAAVKKEWQRISFDKNEINLNPLVNNIISNNSDKIVICGAGKSVANMIIKLREKGYKNEIVTTLGFKSSGADLLIGKDINTTLIDFKKIEVNQDFKDVADNFYKENDRMPNPAEVIFFNSALLVYKSEIEANSSSANNIASIIKKSDFELLGGKEKITESNDITPEIVLEKIK